VKTMEYEYYKRKLEEAIEEGRGIREAAEDYVNCLLEVMSAQESHIFDVMERTYEQWQTMMEAYEAFFGRIKPRPPRCGLRSLEIRQQIFSEPEKAMIFSNKLAQAFTDAKIELKDDEIFTCTICIRKKPKYITELMGTLSSRGHPPINFITEPKIMNQLMEIVEKDRIR